MVLVLVNDKEKNQDHMNLYFTVDLDPCNDLRK